jgi:hypothetical protein
MICLCAFLKTSLDVRCSVRDFVHFEPPTEVVLDSATPKLLKIRLFESLSLS